jgi:serine/threonine protein kinase
MDMAVSVRISSLADTPRREVEAWLADFQQSWSRKQLKRIVRQLPRVGDPRRLPALVELVKIDLQRHWDRRTRVRIETYLRAFPELLAVDLLVDLIETEVAVRRRAGAAVDLASFRERFPDVVDQLRRIDLSASSAKSPSTEDQRYSTRDSYGPVAMPLLHHAPGQSGATGLPEQFGRYRILRKLGQGGMGSVYLAHDNQLDRRLALKVPLFWQADCPRVLERFYREARAAATLSHPNICPVYDVGTIDGVHFVTMAYIEGRPLSELINSRNHLPQKSVASVVRKLALAMQEAHDRGIIHRDLKPSNIMINQRSEPVIMDFGLARRAQEKVRLTQSGAIVGTPGYMSPEQVNADTKAIGPASDVYSLGVILYEMLTNHVPFDGPAPAVLAAILIREPPRPFTYRADLDPELEAICLRTIAREIPDRYGSMRELAAALTSYLKSDGSGKMHARERPGTAASTLANTSPVTARQDTEISGTSPPQLESVKQAAVNTSSRTNPTRGWNRCTVALGGAILAAAVGAATWAAVAAGNQRQPLTAPENGAEVDQLPPTAEGPSP